MRIEKDDIVKGKRAKEVLEDIKAKLPVAVQTHTENIKALDIEKVSVNADRLVEVTTDGLLHSLNSVIECLDRSITSIEKINAATQV